MTTAPATHPYLDCCSPVGAELRVAAVSCCTEPPVLVVDDPAFSPVDPEPAVLFGNFNRGGRVRASRADLLKGAFQSSYDESRDPVKDLQNAMIEATRTNKKRILVDVGGDWCVYCGMMDATFDGHPQLRKVRDTYFVTVKVNYSKENPNDAFLSKYPRIADYPNFSFSIPREHYCIRSPLTGSNTARLITLQKLMTS